MKRIICIALSLNIVFSSACFSSNTGKAQSEPSPKSGGTPVITIGDRFRTDMKPVTGLTVKGQQVDNIKDMEKKAKNNKVLKNKTKKK